MEQSQWLKSRMTKEEMQEYTQTEIDGHDITMFTKGTCSSCKAAEKLFCKCGVKTNIVELDMLVEGRDMQSYLKKKTGQKTVPNIFIKSKHFGGFSDL